MNIFPEKVIRSTNTSTGIDSSVYSFDGYNNLQFINIGVVLISLLLVSPFASVILLCLTSFVINKKPIILPLIGMVISAYIIYDLSTKGFFSCMMNIIIDYHNKIKVVYLNGAVFLANIIVIFFSDFIYRARMKSLIIVLIILAISLFLSNIFFTDFCNIIIP
jgi:hypothetical protein